MKEGTIVDTLEQSIRDAMSSRMWYAAVTMALTIPDICAALETPSESVKIRYKRWYNAYFSGRFPYMTDDDCFSLRNGVVHEGTFGTNGQYRRIILLLPNEDPTRGSVSGAGILLGDAMVVDARMFCEQMLDAMCVWYASSRTNPVVQGNLPRLVQLRPNGLAPYISGMAVIA